MSVRVIRSSSQHLNAASSPVNGGPVTIACWFYPVNFADFQVLLSINNTGTTYQNFRLDFRGDNSGDPVEFTTLGSGTYGSAVATKGVSGIRNWYHACGVEVSTTSRFAYFNGANRGSNTTSMAVTSQNNVKIGAYKFGTFSTEAYFDGWIAYPTIWNVALNDGEIWALSRGTPPWRIRPWAIVSCLKLVQSPRDERAMTWTVSGGASISGMEPRIKRPSRMIAFTGTSPPPSGLLLKLQHHGAFISGAHV